MAYTRINWENSPSENTPLSAENLNNIENGIEDVDTRLTTAEGEIDNLQTGWIPANETWTYASVDDPTGVITISGDVTTKYSLGMRIKFTNGGNVIYGIITAISYTSPSTTLTFLHEIDPTDSLALYLMANSTITNNYYSNVKVPYGFPLDTDKWSIKNTSTTAIKYTSPTIGLWYPGISIKVPKGQWRLQYKAKFECDMPSALDTNVFGGICTSSNGNPIIDYVSNASGKGGVQFTLSYSDIVDITSDTTYYLSAKTGVSGAQYLYIIGFPDGPAIIQATIAYL